MTIVAAIQRFMGNTVTQIDEAREMRERRAALRDAITSRDAAQRAFDEAQARLKRAEDVAANAATTISASIDAARALRAARASARAAALTQGEAGPGTADAELASRESAQLAALGEARLQKKAAEQALPELKERAEQATLARRQAEEALEERVQSVVRAQAAWMTRDIEYLAGELSERYRWLAAAAELVGGIGPPIVPQLRFNRAAMAEQLAAIQGFRKGLETDAQAQFNV